jgi:hypothetical protein
MEALGRILEARMKRLVLVGSLVVAIAASPAFAAAQGTTPKPAGKSGAAAQAGGHTAPKPQPAVEPAPTAPEGQVMLGTVRIPKAVKADGKPLPAGTYQVRLTTEQAGPDAKGQSESLERWAEFVKGGKVVGREIMTIVPQGEIAKVQKDAPPPRGGSKVETLKGGDYLRVWINRGGNHYLMHLPV